MNPVKFIWLPLYLLAAFIHHLSYGDHAVESLVTVLPAFIVGLVPALIVYFIFKRTKWSWYHVMNLATGIMVVWVLVNV